MKREFMIERQGRAFVLYAGLLDEAHSQGLKSIRTSLIQVPGPENGTVAICFAEVITDKGTYTGIGDASPDNVARMMVPHIIRMAETRAKARALRDSINVGVTAFEELGDDDDDRADQPTRPRDRASEPGRIEVHGDDSAHRLTQMRAAQPTQAVAQAQAVGGGTAPAPASSPAAGPTSASVPTASSGILATTNQVRAIYSIARGQHSLNETQVEEKTVSLYGATPAELTRKQASDFIDALKSGDL